MECDCRAWHGPHGLIIFPVRSYGFQCEHGSWIMIPDLELAIVIASGEQRISDQHYAVRPEYERSFKVFSRQLVPSDRRLHILDIGCGTGLNAQHLAAQGHSVVGLDLSPVAIEKFRAKGALIGVAVDPNSSHDCGNSRYLAIPWFDACLAARLPDKVGDPLKSMPTENV